MAIGVYLNDGNRGGADSGNAYVYEWTVDESGYSVSIMSYADRNIVTIAEAP